MPYRILKSTETQLRAQIVAALNELDTLATGAVLESDYNANTILAANTDDTPLPLTVAEQTLVGRITGGNIDDLSVSQVRTLLSIVDNVTHTGEVTGATALTVDKTAITNRTTVQPEPVDSLLISDVSDSDSLKKTPTYQICSLYRPALMQYNGSTGYYSRTYTSSGNKVSTLFRFRCAPFTGGGNRRIAFITNGTYNRTVISVGAGDNATTTRRNKLIVSLQSSAGAALCLLVSSVELCDGNPHTALFAFDGDSGLATFYVGGQSEDDITNPERIAPTAGTLPTGGSSVITVGRNPAGSEYFLGSIGIFGHHNVYTSNWSDFMYENGPVKEIDELTWSQFGSQPLFFNPHGQLENNIGTAGNLTKSGAVLLTFDSFGLSTGLVV